MGMLIFDDISYLLHSEIIPLKNAITLYIDQMLQILYSVMPGAQKLVEGGGVGTPFGKGIA